MKGYEPLDCEGSANWFQPHFFLDIEESTNDDTNTD